MQRLEISGAVRTIYGSLGVKGLWINFASQQDIKGQKINGFIAFL